MKRYNITSQKTYTKNGEEKKTYPQVGKLVQFDDTDEKKGGMIIELNMFPGTKFYVFEDEQKVVKDDETGEVIPPDLGKPKVHSIDDIMSVPVENIPF